MVRIVDDIFNGHGVEIKLTGDNFLKVKETLTRIGVASKTEKKLFQSCHILHKQGRYAIVHFKELFSLDGKQTNFSPEDVGRRNQIVKLLVEWGLVEVVNKSEQMANQSMANIKVVSYRDKGDWELVPKYTIGNKRKS